MSQSWPATHWRESMARWMLSLTRDLPDAKSYRVTFRNGQWHVAFAVIPDPIDAPGTGEVIGIDGGVTITAALSDGRKLNCPQLTVKERAQIRKHQRRAARAPKGSPEKTAEYAKAARLKAREANRRKDWCEKTSTMLARTYDVVRFERLNIKNMTASAKGTVEKPGKNVRQKAAGGCFASAPDTKPLGALKMYPLPTPACDAARADGSTRTRARAKPSSVAPPAASPATQTPTQQPTSRQDRAAFPAPGEQLVPEG